MVFFDSWAWITLSSQKEKEFGSLKKKVAENIQNKVPIVTSDFVLDETITFIFKRLGFRFASVYFSGIFASVERGAIQLIPVTSERFWKAWQLRLQFSDKPEISFTDLTSFIIMRELGIHDVVTDDRHFSIVNLGFLRVK